jgi:hypothetical protein
MSRSGPAPAVPRPHRRDRRSHPPRARSSPGPSPRRASRFLGPRRRNPSAPSPPSARNNASRRSSSPLALRSASRKAQPSPRSCFRARPLRPAHMPSLLSLWRPSRRSRPARPVVSRSLAARASPSIAPPRPKRSPPSARRWYSRRFSHRRSR